MATEAKCAYCEDDESPLIDVCGTLLCKDCEELERTEDWDDYDARIRERIAEGQEH